MPERTDELVANLQNQLVEKVKQFVAFSLALDKSTDITDTSVFIWRVDVNSNVTEELLGVTAMHDSTKVN